MRLRVCQRSRTEHKTCFGKLAFTSSRTDGNHTIVLTNMKGHRCYMNEQKCVSRLWVSCLALLLLGFVAACNNSGDEEAPGAASVSLTDAPACGFDAVNVTVSTVRIHQSSSADEKDAGWTDITLNPPRKINL